jgi:hypothetical protein
MMQSSMQDRGGPPPRAVPTARESMLTLKFTKAIR